MRTGRWPARGRDGAAAWSLLPCTDAGM